MDGNTAIDYSSMSDAELEMLAYYEKRREQQVQNAEYFDTALDAITGFSQGATLGYGDEIYAGTKWLEAAAQGMWENLNGGDVDVLDTAREEAKRAWEMEQIRIAATQERSPVASTAGELAAMAPFLGKLAATKAPVLLTGAYGAIKGFGSGDGLDSRLQRAAVEGGIMGATAGTANLIIPTVTALGRAGVYLPTRLADAILPQGFGKGIGATARAAITENPAKAGMALAATGAISGNPLLTAAGTATTLMAPFRALTKADPWLAPFAGGLAGADWAPDLAERYVENKANEIDYSALSDDELDLAIKYENNEIQDFESLSDDELDLIIKLEQANEKQN